MLLLIKHNKLKTEEFTIDHKKAEEIIKSTKIQLSEKETIIKEGCFYVDGIKNASNEDLVTYFLKNNEKEIRIDIHNKNFREILFKNIGKIIFAKIEITKKMVPLKI